jgi:CheY-like chemotaxis protein
VPKTLLAVDDSATMRKVLEITFAGEDFRVLTAEGSQKALAHMSEDPVAVVIDTSLDGDDPYALAKQLRSRSASAVIVMMASRYTPYDANKGRDAGADDFIDKPFDTQAFIDKMKKALAAREAGKGAPVAAAAAPAPSPQPPAAHPAPAFPGASPRPPVVSPTAPSLVGQAPPRPAIQVQRTHTLSFEGSSPVPPPAAPPPVITSPPLSRTAPSGMPAFQPPAPPAPPPAPAAPPPRAPEAAPVAAAVNGHLASKLGDLGLSPAQVDAVLALSREVVERVVWEVVPQLAETIIKEEIARLTKE